LKQSDGFTLVELIVIIAIILVISSIAVPSLISWRTESKIRGAIINLRGDMELARARSIKENLQVTIDFSSTGYSIYIDEDEDETMDSGEQLIRNVDFIGGVSIDLAATSFASDKTWYNSRGLPQNLGRVVLKSTGGTLRRISMTTLLGQITIERSTDNGATWN
jgi:type IV fimbrial biogenesis protein FimT